MSAGSIEEGLRELKRARLGGLSEFMKKYEEIVRRVRDSIHERRIVYSFLNDFLIT